MVFKPGDRKQPGSGRKAGTPNKKTDEGSKLAMPHTKLAMSTLVDILESKDEDGRAKVAAAKEIMERAYGRSGAMLGIDPTNNEIRVVLVGDDAKL